MLGILAAIFYGLVVFDAAFTRRRMRIFGLNVEMNPLIKSACALLGLEFGLLVSLLAPASLLTLLFVWTHFQVGFAALIGFRARAAYVQLMSLRFEKQIREFRRKIMAGNYPDLGADKKSAPPSARSIPDKDVEASAPINSLEDKDVK